ncbi:DNA mismatch repair ATPase MutS [Algoriphagus sp. 4150]|uniref:MutS-related protein n=1 Tax=Algoriphagus sp. 4150 TaxID=2817756 RepID=UPI00285A63BA|nr:hypothetical protein [Algoriphagus sp. 4150]MDR7130045.1 DNA mismatch repair ATPase MutS [Algoriphagus sp. 4150]
MFLIKAYKRFEDGSEFFKRVDDVAQRELKIINNDIPTGKVSVNRIEKNHVFAFDLDVLGDNSLFSRLNRTSSQISESLLVDSLTKLSSDLKNIYRRQKSTAELSQKISKIVDFNAIALQYFESQSEVSLIDQALNDRSRKVGLGLVFSSIALSQGALLTLVLAISQVLPHQYWMILVTINLIVTYWIKQAKSDKKLALDKSIFIIKKYQELADHLNKFGFEDGQLKSLSADCGKNSAILAKLRSILNFQKSSNFITNGFFLLDIHVIRKIESLKSESKIDFGNMVLTICQIEELISIAFFKFNNPTYTFPLLTDKQGILNFNELGHPFVLRENCITNDFNPEAKVNIVTGSNMSGKSTFLRSVGINFVLAHIGAPVFASRFETSLGNLFTSIKTVDSLNEQKSFFYSEILRLSEIQRDIDENKWALVLLDEALKGTNSEDKLSGSISLATKFSKLNCMLFFATHDVQMGILENQNKDVFSNYCFESEVSNNEVIYDFKLRKGVAKSKNATILLKNLGVID